MRLSALHALGIAATMSFFASMSHAQPHPPAQPVQCLSGEIPAHGHCCPPIADWAGNRCTAHNHRRAVLTVEVTAAAGQLPADVTVALDGTAMQGSPAQGEVDTGSHQVRVSASGFDAADQSVTLTAGGVQRVSFSLHPSLGSVEVHVSTPHAVVTLDGQPLTGSPPSRTDVTPGTHRINVTADGHEPVSREVPVAAGQRAIVEIGDLAIVVTTPPVVTAAPQPPTVQVAAPTQVLTIAIRRPLQRFEVDVIAGGHTAHCAAEVTRDTPCVLRDLPAGTATVRVRGLSEFSDTVHIPEGASTVDIDFASQPALQGVYIGLAVATLIPAAIAYGAFGACPSGSMDCSSFLDVGIGLTLVPAVLPGAIFWSSGFRPQGSGSISLHAGEPGSVQSRASDIPIPRHALAPPPAERGLLVF